MMEATKPAGTIRVGIFDRTVRIQIAGRGTFTSSLDLKNVVNELWDRGYKSFIFDLCDCVIMDSTFLGVLAGVGLKFDEANEKADGCFLAIANPNERIADLLEDLGVAHLFKVIELDAAKENLQPVAQSENNSRVEVARTCLEAHKTLMTLNSENAVKFKDVAQFLAEDLKKLEAKES